MNNIMVCVTKQKTCQRLIDYGKKLRKSDEDQLFVIHIAKSDDPFLDNSEEGEALEFLYEKARDAGASLTVEKSDDVMKTLIDIVDRNEITEVITGQSGEKEGRDSFLDRLNEYLAGRAELIIVPAIS